MRVPDITKGKILLGTMLMLVVAQVFSIHLHFAHAEQTHDVHVHSTLAANHDLLEEGISDHGEESDFDFVGWFGKKLSAFYLLAFFCYILILPCLIPLRLPKIDVHRLHWQYRYFFHPHLRGPPLNS